MKLEAHYSPLHKKWLVSNPDRHELVLGSGKSKGEALADAERNIRRFGTEDQKRRFL